MKTQSSYSDPHATAAAPLTKGTRWLGYVVSGLPVLFLLMDGVMKLVKPAAVVQATVQLGYPESCIGPLGAVLLLSTVLYAVPRTAVLGAILLTGYLGGAVATHVRVSASWFNIPFPAVFGVLLWAGPYLRDQRIRQLL